MADELCRVLPECNLKKAKEIEETISAVDKQAEAGRMKVHGEAEGISIVFAGKKCVYVNVSKQV